MEYLYFVVGSSINREDKIEEIFNNGIICNNNNLFKNAIYVDSNDENIINSIKDIGFDTLFLIRIPKMYVSPKVVNNQLKEIPLPMWKLENGIYSITNELIYGAYKRKEKNFLMNDQYSELHNPKGLIFDDKQIKLFEEHNMTKWSNLASKLDNHEYNTLVKNDKLNNLWDITLRQYQNYYSKKSR